MYMNRLIVSFYIFKLQVYLKIESNPVIHVVGNMISNKYASDISFIVGEKVVHAHKVILSRCDFFKAMFSFEGNMNSTEIIIEEEERPFLAIVEYIYTGELNPMYSDQSLFILELSEKYSLEDRIKHLCAYNIYENLLDYTNLDDVYTLAKHKDDKLLIYSCELFMGRHFDTLKNRGYFEKKPNDFIERVQSLTSNQKFFSKFLYKNLSFSSQMASTRSTLVLGDNQVGKSNLILKFTQTNDTMCKYQFTDSNQYKLDLHITEVSKEQDNYFTLLKGVDSYVVCYSVTEEKSFLRVKEFIKDIYDSGDSPYNIVICALKMDLTFNRTVSQERGLKLAEEYDSSYFEISSDYSFNLTQLWNEVAQISFVGRNIKESVQ